MTVNEAESLVKLWAIYQCGSQDTKAGPREIAAPMGSASDHGREFLSEYQFVQKQIEVYCDKAYDRSMLTAILISRYWHGRALRSHIVDEFCQGEAIDKFLERFEVLSFDRPKKLEIA